MTRGDSLHPANCTSGSAAGRIPRRYVLILAILISVIAAGSSHAQEKPQAGVVEGRVFDRATYEPLAGANVQVIGTTMGGSTDPDGRFRINGVPVGSYAVRGSKIGYTPLTISDVVVSVSKPAEVLIPLTEDTIQTETVEVTASYFQKLPEAPVSTFTQSNEEIRRLPGGLEDVVRAISILPGVAQVQAGRNDLIVRGGAPSENLFVIDNIEVPNINHFGTQGATGGPLSFVNLDFVRETSFSAGGFGVQYGDKLSSVLSIALREGRKDRLGGKATVSASQFGVNLEGPSGGDGTFVFSVRRSYLDLFFKAAGFSFVPEYWDFLGKAEYHLGRSDRISVLAIAAFDDVKFFNDSRQHRFDNSRVLGDRQNQIVGGISWEHFFANGLLSVSLGQTYVEYSYGQSDSLLVPIFRNNSLQYESSLRTNIVFHPSKSTEISVGMLSIIPRFSSDVTLRPIVTSYGDSLQANASYGATAFKGAGYIQASQDVGGGRITFGGRVDYFNLIASRVVFSPRFSATHPLTEGLNLNLSAGRYYQAPSYIWLVSNPANRDLKFVGANQYIVGVDAVIRADTRVSLEGYRKDYFDYPVSLLRPYLVLANTGAGFGGSEDGFASFGLDRLASRGSGRSRGAELLVQKKFSDIPCYGTFSVSYSLSEFRALDGIVRPSSWDQRWIINLGGGYVFNGEWECSAKFRYATGRPYTPFNSGGTQNPDMYNAVRVVPNHSLDVRVDRRWSFTSWTLITYVDIQNIYNRRPVDVPIFNPETGLVEQNGSIGILPSIGVSAEF